MAAAYGETKHDQNLSFIDCHSHLAASDFDQDLEDVIDRAKKGGVVAALVCAISASDCEKVLQLTDRFPDFCLPCLGVHPVQPGTPESGECSVTENELEEARPWIEQNHDRMVAVGEVGLDFTPRFCKNEGDKDAQRSVLRQQVELAKKYNLPLNVHSRSAGRPTIELLKESGAEHVLLHAFDGRPAVAMAGVDAGFYFSIPPSIVRSEQKLVKRLPLENMLLETDSPALGPVKQERNEPFNIRISCEEIARIKKVSVETVARITSENALKLFPRLKALIR